MSDSKTIKDGKASYTATVAAETDLSSPVTVTGKNCTVQFDGNDFETKHLRRIRRQSVIDLKNSITGPGKLTQYINEASEKSVDRWKGKESSTNSRVYLDLEEYCKFGCQIIKVVNDSSIAWTPWGPNNIMQKHATVTLGKCLAYSHNGIGFAKESASGRVEGGVGITLNVTIQQVNGNPNLVSVCHYAGGDVKGKFKSEYGDKKDLEKRRGIANSIVN